MAQKKTSPGTWLILAFAGLVVLGFIVGRGNETDRRDFADELNRSHPVRRFSVSGPSGTTMSVDYPGCGHHPLVNEFGKRFVYVTLHDKGFERFECSDGAGAVDLE